MKHTSSLLKFVGLVSFAVGAMLVCQPATADDDTSRRVVIKRKSTPTMLRPYTCTAYAKEPGKITTMKGDMLFNTGKDTIVAFDVNPAGFNFIVVDKNKNKSQAGIYSLFDVNRRTAKFDAKLYGSPHAAVFTPDARSIYVATDKGLFLCNAWKLIPDGSPIELPFMPDIMTVSPNGYFLVACKGENLVVFNLDNRTIRKRINVGATITDAMFSPDNSDMAVLTDDGVMTIYSTRTFDMRKMIDELGNGLAFAYNFDGKYAAVVADTGTVLLVNLLNDKDREEFLVDGGCVNDVVFMTDAANNTFMAYTTLNAVEAAKLMHLKPYYNRLINDETDAMMAEWLKMMPGETLDEYRARVNEQTRSEMRRMFEYEISTRLAGDVLSGNLISLGAYDRANKVLAINFDRMPTIFLPVPENEVVEFKSGDDLTFSDVLYGVNPDDSFEIVYAKVTNRNNNRTYVFDNLGRATMNYMHDDDAISIETLQQQQMEELRLQELREKVMAEAKSMNVISEHTNITVDSRIVPDYDADGKRILNYLVSVTYDVEPGFSAQEDFGPGKYQIGESGAASSMAKIVKEAFEGDFARYIKSGKKLRIVISGTADATPIVRGIPYNGCYGYYDNEPVYINGRLSSLSVNPDELIKENSQLAFLRALGVKDFLEHNVENFNTMLKDYRYEVNVSDDKGSEYRRITVSFTFVDALQ